ncbi:MAG: 2-hydroxyglutaryl-CoA dehydratase [Deltaproteobacteria bacterium]|nr:2-hydroxyglutaryl-CoA dehydratase [Deltaproteobacteria bacterium]
MTYFLGVDIGSACSKSLIIRGDDILGTYECPSGGNFRATAEKVRRELLSRVGVSPEEVSRTVATGYGARRVAYADKKVTDMTCQGRGVFHLFPPVRTIVDVGDISAKAIKIDERGNLVNFLSSGKCAGGSGRILKVMAKVLQVDLADLGKLSQKAAKRAEFSTGCAVFAETEAISRIAEGVSREDLLAGLHWALASQLNGLAERVGIEREYALVGGGARDEGLVEALEEINGFRIIVPPEPQMTCALGAALVARDDYYSEK